MKYSEIVMADVRHIILDALAQDADYSQNEYVLDAILSSFGHSIPSDQLYTQLAWLDEQGLIKLEMLSEVRVAKLTKRGEDVALGRAQQPGVRRPGPGA